MDMSQSGAAACAIAHASNSTPLIGRYTLEGPFDAVECFLDRANQFIDSAALPGLESAVCYLDEWKQTEGLEPIYVAFIDLPLSAFGPFVRSISA